MRNNTSFSRTVPATPSGTRPSRATDHYHLLPTQTTDALGNRTTADHDYRLLQPFRVTDPNGNRAEVAFDTLGLVAGTAVMGKATEMKGDSLAGFAPNLSPQQRQAFLADPLGTRRLAVGTGHARASSTTWSAISARNSPSSPPPWPVKRTPAIRCQPAASRSR